MTGCLLLSKITGNCGEKKNKQTKHQGLTVDAGVVVLRHADGEKRSEMGEKGKKKGSRMPDQRKKKNWTKWHNSEVE